MHAGYERRYLIKESSSSKATIIPGSLKKTREILGLSSSDEMVQEDECNAYLKDDVVSISSHIQVHNEDENYRVENPSMNESSQQKNTVKILLNEQDWKRVSSFQRSGFYSQRMKLSEQKSLSAAILQNPNSIIDLEKVSLVGCQISILNNISQQNIAMKIKVLYLSNNNISNTDGIQYLSNLRTLSLSNNIIRYLSDIDQLSLLPHLEKLSLEGNIIVQMPYYKEYVLSKCTKLSVLDGQKIPNEYRNNVKPLVRKAMTVLDQLRINELRNTILSHMSTLVLVHADLLHVVMGRYRSFRSAHMPTTEQCKQLAAVNISSVLTVALRGGVFRWLQIAAGNDFDCIAQDLCHSVFLVVQKKLSQAEKVKLQNSISMLYNLWDEILNQSLHQQQRMSIQLLGLCEKAHDRRDRVMQQFVASSSMKQSSHISDTDKDYAVDVGVTIGGECSARTSLRPSACSDVEVLTVLQMLQFESIRSSSIEYRQTYCGLGMHHLPLPTTLPRHSSISYSSGASQSDKKLSKDLQMKSDVASLQSTENGNKNCQNQSPSPGSSRNTSSTCTRSDDVSPNDRQHEAVEQKEVQRKYLSLLKKNQHRKGAATHDTADLSPKNGHEAVHLNDEKQAVEFSNDSRLPIARAAPRSPDIVAYSAVSSHTSAVGESLYEGGSAQASVESSNSSQAVRNEREQKIQTERAQSPLSQDSRGSTMNNGTKTFTQSSSASSGKGNATSAEGGLLQTPHQRSNHSVSASSNNFSEYDQLAQLWEGHPPQTRNSSLLNSASDDSITDSGREWRYPESTLSSISTQSSSGTGLSAREGNETSGRQETISPLHARTLHQTEYDPAVVITPRSNAQSSPGVQSVPRSILKQNSSFPRLFSDSENIPPNELQTLNNQGALLTDSSANHTHSDKASRQPLIMLCSTNTPMQNLNDSNHSNNSLGNHQHPYNSLSSVMSSEKSSEKLFIRQVNDPVSVLTPNSLVTLLPPQQRVSLELPIGFSHSQACPMRRDTPFTDDTARSSSVGKKQVHWVDDQCAITDRSFGNTPPIHTEGRRVSVSTPDSTSSERGHSQARALSCTVPTATQGPVTPLTSPGLKVSSKVIEYPFDFYDLAEEEKKWRIPSLPMKAISTLLQQQKMSLSEESPHKDKTPPGVSTSIDSTASLSSNGKASSMSSMIHHVHCVEKDLTRRIRDIQIASSGRKKLSSDANELQIAVRRNVEDAHPRLLQRRNLLRSMWEEMVSVNKQTEDLCMAFDEIETQKAKLDGLQKALRTSARERSELQRCLEAEQRKHVDFSRAEGEVLEAIQDVKVELDTSPELHIVMQDHHQVIVADSFFKSTSMWYSRRLALHGLFARVKRQKQLKVFTSTSLQRRNLQSMIWTFQTWWLYSFSQKAIKRFLRLRELKMMKRIWKVLLENLNKGRRWHAYQAKQRIFLCRKGLFQWQTYVSHKSFERCRELDLNLRKDAFILRKCFVGWSRHTKRISLTPLDPKQDNRNMEIAYYHFLQTLFYRWRFVAKSSSDTMQRKAISIMNRSVQCLQSRILYDWAALLLGSYQWKKIKKKASLTVWSQRCVEHLYYKQHVDSMQTHYESKLKTLALSKLYLLSRYTLHLKASSESVRLAQTRGLWSLWRRAFAQSNAKCIQFVTKQETAIKHYFHTLLRKSFDRLLYYIHAMLEDSSPDFLSDDGLSYESNAASTATRTEIDNASSQQGDRIPHTFSCNSLQHNDVDEMSLSQQYIPYSRVMSLNYQFKQPTRKDYVIHRGIQEKNIRSCDQLDSFESVISSEALDDDDILSAEPSELFQAFHSHGIYRARSSGRGDGDRGGGGAGDGRCRYAGEQHDGDVPDHSSESSSGHSHGGGGRDGLGGGDELPPPPPPSPGGSGSGSDSGSSSGSSSTDSTFVTSYSDSSLASASTEGSTLLSLADSASSPPEEGGRTLMARRRKIMKKVNNYVESQSPMPSAVHDNDESISMPLKLVTENSCKSLSATHECASNSIEKDASSDTAPSAGTRRLRLQRMSYLDTPDPPCENDSEYTSFTVHRYFSRWLDIHRNKRRIRRLEQVLVTSMRQKTVRRTFNVILQSRISQLLCKTRMLRQRRAEVGEPNVRLQALQTSVKSTANDVEALRKDVDNLSNHVATVHARNDRASIQIVSLQKELCAVRSRRDQSLTECHRVKDICKSILESIGKSSDSEGNKDSSSIPISEHSTLDNKGQPSLVSEDSHRLPSRDSILVHLQQLRASRRKVAADLKIRNQQSTDRQRITQTEIVKATAHLQQLERSAAVLTEQREDVRVALNKCQEAVQEKSRSMTEETWALDAALKELDDSIGMLTLQKQTLAAEESSLRLQLDELRDGSGNSNHDALEMADCEMVGIEYSARASGELLVAMENTNSLRLESTQQLLRSMQRWDSRGSSSLLNNTESLTQSATSAHLSDGDSGRYLESGTLCNRTPLVNAIERESALLRAQREAAIGRDLTGGKRLLLSFNEIRQTTSTSSVPSSSLSSNKSGSSSGSVSASGSLASSPSDGQSDKTDSTSRNDDSTPGSNTGPMATAVADRSDPINILSGRILDRLLRPPPTV